MPCTSRSPGCSLARALSSHVLWLLITIVASVLAGLLVPDPLSSLVLWLLITIVVSVLAGLLAPLTLYVHECWQVSGPFQIGRG